jgi:hypothetical protein
MDMVEGNLTIAEDRILSLEACIHNNSGDKVRRCCLIFRLSFMRYAIVPVIVSVCVVRILRGWWPLIPLFFSQHSFPHDPSPGHQVGTPCTVLLRGRA